MAYAVLIGSIPETQLGEFQASERQRLEASKVVHCSHILASWVTVAPLNRVLREAIDGGQLMRADRSQIQAVFAAGSVACTISTDTINYSGSPADFGCSGITDNYGIHGACLCSTPRQPFANYIKN